MSNIHNELTDVLSKLGRWQEAKQESLQAIELMEKLVADFPDVPLYQHHLAHYHNRLSGVLSRAGRRQEAEQEQHLVVEIYEKLIADFPDIHNDLVLLGNIYLRLRQWDKMASNYTQAILLNPAHHEHWKQRGRAYAELGQFEKAALDFSKGAELKPDRGSIWYRQAAAQLGAGQMEEYRRTCANMLQRFGRAEDPISANWVGWTCALVPQALENLDQVVQLAEKAAESEETKGGYHHTLGAILYRAGRFDEAIQKLSDLTAYTSTWFFMAMAHHQLGHLRESRKWLDKAVELTEQEIQDEPSWDRRLTLQLLRQEAELLIGQSEQTTPDGEEVVPGKEE